MATSWSQTRASSQTAQRLVGGTGDPPANSTDMSSVATHEAGHTYGLNRAAGHFLTMYDTNCRGCIRARDLGRGDMLGYDAMRPPPGS
jgi:hypothetical protein